jgi:CRP-like cAMP-binding protein
MKAELSLSLPAAGQDLRRIALFRDHSTDDLERIFAAIEVREMRRGGTLLFERDLARRVCFVWSGAYRLIVASPPKRPVTLSILRPGETFGHVTSIMDANWGPRLRVVCDESGALLELDANKFTAFRRSIPALAEATLTMISTLAADHASRIFELSALTARERVQAEILRLARHGEWRGRRCILKPAPTHEALAAQIGAAREVVTRALRAMNAEGLIKIERGSIECLDIDRLLALDQAATGRRLFDPQKYGSKP